MKMINKIVVSCALCFSLSTLAEAQLPPEVRADLLQKKIITSLQSKDFDAVKSQISEYKNLGISVPPAILIIDAKISVSEKKWGRAKSKLEAYFTEAGKTHASYSEALTLYETVDAKVSNIKFGLEPQRQAMFNLVKKIGRDLSFRDTFQGKEYYQKLADKDRARKSREYKWRTYADHVDTPYANYYDQGLAFVYRGYDVPEPIGCHLKIDREAFGGVNSIFRNIEQGTGIDELDFKFDRLEPFIVKLEYVDDVPVYSGLFEISDRDDRVLRAVNFYVLQASNQKIPFLDHVEANKTADSLKKLNRMCKAYLEDARIID